MSEKVVLFGPVDPCIRFWPFWASLEQIRTKFLPDLAFYVSYSDFLCKFHTQGLKPLKESPYLSL